MKSGGGDGELEKTISAAQTKSPEKKHSRREALEGNTSSFPVPLSKSMLKNLINNGTMQ